MLYILNSKKCRYIGAQCYASNAKKADLELCVCMCTDTHTYFLTHRYLFQISAKFNVTFWGRGWMAGEEKKKKDIQL